MKTRAILGLSIAVALSSPAWAAAPPDSGTLGALDAWAIVCGKVAPVAAGTYENYVTTTIGNPPAATLSALRATPAYKQALLAMRDIYWNELPRKNLRHDCLVAIGQAGVPIG